MSVASYIGAIDQGTTSTRFTVFDRSGRAVATAQKEHEQIYPQPGWVEHDAEEIWRRTQDVITEAMQQRGLRAGDMAAIGRNLHGLQPAQRKNVIDCQRSRKSSGRRRWT